MSDTKSKPQEVTRYIKQKIERELWARAAGRCKFGGCNRLLYKSPVTLEQVNISEIAHIYSFSPNGPRGHEELKNNSESINNIENLMLLCHDCHKTIDQDKDGSRYSASLLRQWKEEHEQRIVTVTSIVQNKKSHVVFYSSNISEQKSPLQQQDAIAAMFPDHYPATSCPISLSMSSSLEDKTPVFWEAETEHLKGVFNQKISPLIENDPIKHFSLFALAPIPLLIKLGTLFTDKTTVDVYQPIREPQGWHWQDFPEGFELIINKPDSFNETPVLVISLSDIINYERIKSVMGEQVSVWELTVPEGFHGNDNIRNPKQLSMIRRKIRQLMVMIKNKHGADTPLSIFSAMSVSCAFEMGRVRMPKADMPWIIYDQNNKEKKFIKAITIG